jgi:hypothetical protein
MARENVGKGEDIPQGDGARKNMVPEEKMGPRRGYGLGRRGSPWRRCVFKEMGLGKRGY